MVGQKGQLSAYPMLNLEEDAVLKMSRGNFRMPFTDIAAVEYNAAKKWGMGAVPYSGRIFVKINHDQREFILIGTESGGEVRDRLDTMLKGIPT